MGENARASYQFLCSVQPLHCHSCDCRLGLEPTDLPGSQQPPEGAVVGGQGSASGAHALQSLNPATSQPHSPHTHPQLMSEHDVHDASDSPSQPALEPAPPGQVAQADWAQPYSHMPEAAGLQKEVRLHEQMPFLHVSQVSGIRAHGSDSVMRLSTCTCVGRGACCADIAPHPAPHLFCRPTSLLVMTGRLA